MMHSRRDQSQAHSFLVGRLVCALVRGDADLAVTPLRRTTVGLVIGLMVAILAVAVAAAVAVIAPGGAATKWRKPGTLIVEKQTGTRYVYADGRLRPVLNLASALLLLGARPAVAHTPRSALAGVPKGPPVGIVGAPDSLPGRRPGDGRWLACAATGRDAAGADRPELTVSLDQPVRTDIVPADRAVLVRTADGIRYLAWRDRRMKLAAGWVDRALGYDAGSALPVRDGWLNTLPAGPDLGGLGVSHRGRPAPAVDGSALLIGQVLVVEAVGVKRRFFVATGAGLLPVTETGAALALGDPATLQAYPDGPAEARKLSATALATATILPAPADLAELPPSPPALLPGAPDWMPCVQVIDGTAALVTADPRSDSASAVTGPGLDRDGRTADRIGVRPGGGLLARPLSGSGDALYLVCEFGAKFLLADQETATALGFAAADAADVPAELLNLLPTGPVLRRPAGAGDPSDPSDPGDPGDPGGSGGSGGEAG